MKLKKVIKLNLVELTHKKQKALSKLTAAYNEAARESLGILRKQRLGTQNEFHRLTYAAVRSKYNLPAQLAQTIRREIWSRRKKIRQVNNLPLKFESSRACGFGITNRGNPTIAVTTFEKNTRTALPISKDGAYDRLKSFLGDGWSSQSCIIIKKKGEWKAQAIITKDFGEPEPGGVILGVDIGSRNTAAITLYNPAEDRILKQLYIGTDVRTKQIAFNERRRKLQKKGNCRSRSSLKKMASKESDFTTTRIYQIAHDIINLAKKYNASIAFESLRYLRAKRRQFTRKVNGMINRIPYRRLLKAISDIALGEGVYAKEVDPRNTSRACPYCGHVSKKNRKGATFKCTVCGKTANADRIASLNIAKRLATKLSERISTIQISVSRMPVNASLRSDDGQCLQQLSALKECRAL